MRVGAVALATRFVGGFGTIASVVASSTFEGSPMPIALIAETR